MRITRGEHADLSRSEVGPRRCPLSLAASWP